MDGSTSWGDLAAVLNHLLSVDNCKIPLFGLNQCPINELLQGWAQIRTKAAFSCQNQTGGLDRPSYDAFSR